MLNLLPPLERSSHASLDELADLVRMATGAAVALITIVESDRQRFLGLSGLTGPFSEARQTPLSHSFCGHVVADADMLRVEDAAAHPRVSGSPGIRDLGIGAYLGVPLLALDGTVMGAVCAIEPGPRNWSDADAEALRAVSRWVTDGLRYQPLFAHHPLPLWVYDRASLGILLVNDAACALYGYSRDEFLRFTLPDLLVAEEVPRLTEWLAARGPGLVKPGIRRHRLKDGTIISVEITSSDIDLDGRPARLIMALDVGERLRAERERDRAHRRYALVTAASSDAFYEYDPGAGRFAFGTGDDRLLGFDLDSLAPGGWQNRVHPDDRALAPFGMGAADGPAAFETTCRLRAACGRYLWIRCRGRRITDPETGQPRIVGSMSDVSDLVAARNAAEQASRLKSRFLATVSHELRTPLNGVLGVAQLLGMGETDRERLDHLGTIMASGKALLSQIEQLLDLSQIEAGAIELFPEAVDPVAIAARALDALAPEAQSKGLLLHRSQADAPIFCHQDPVRLRQLLDGLLGNAVKFTEAGSVTLTIGTAADGRMLIEVGDTGIGIPAAARERIFEPFQQGDMSTSRRYGGMGLGLSLVRRIVDAMGGTIDFVSSPAGTIFTVHCPIDLPSRPVES